MLGHLANAGQFFAIMDFTGCGGRLFSNQIVRLHSGVPDHVCLPDVKGLA
jgi:hypothetical protein